jgi:hypothetical protein
MSNHALSFRLDELSFAPDTVPVSQEEKMIDQEPCDQWKVWASNSSNRKRKQQNFVECFQIRDKTFGKDDDQDLIENDHVDFRVESHMRLQYHSTIVEDISSVNHQPRDDHGSTTKEATMGGLVWRFSCIQEKCCTAHHHQEFTRRASVKLEYEFISSSLLERERATLS